MSAGGIRTVAIAGVGLIGGSFALALRAAGYTGRIAGISSPKTIADSIERGVIDCGMSLEQAAVEADLLLLATPVRQILSTLPTLATAQSSLLITDAGSTKLRICEAGASIGPVQFLGGHPMAGKAVRGVVAAEATLFEGRPWILTPQRPEDVERGHAPEFRRWLERIGARVVILRPEEHDHVIAAASHLPQMLSTVLAATLRHHPQAEQVAALSGPGLASMTRLALSSYEIWRDILATNPEPIRAALQDVVSSLDQLLQSFDEPAFERAFSEGSDFARTVPRNSEAGE